MREGNSDCGRLGVAGRVKAVASFVSSSLPMIVSRENILPPASVRNAQLRVVAESERFIVIDKPPGLQAHPSKPDGKRTLWHELRELLAFELANGGQVSIINRLDRETSGLTLVAKTAEAARHFSGLMMRGRIAKEYLAIVRGWPEREEYEVDAPIARQGAHGPSRIYLKQCVHSAGAAARTTVRVERRFEHRSAPSADRVNRADPSGAGRFSLVRTVPHTGRMHQIRVHLAHLGHPVVGDKIYGSDEAHYLTFIETGWTPELARSLLLPRHALHSAALRVAGAEDEGLSWSAPLPQDMAAFLAGATSRPEST